MGGEGGEGVCGGGGGGGHPLLPPSLIVNYSKELLLLTVHSQPLTGDSVQSRPMTNGWVSDGGFHDEMETLVLPLR